MGNSLSRYPTNSGQEPYLNLTAAKINPFSGNPEEWHSWKAHTTFALNGSGFGKVIFDLDFAMDNTLKNRIVYLQLRIATLGGLAENLVTAHDCTQNGYLAWNDMVKWFDGSQLKADLAESRRNALEGLRIHSNTTDSSYISKFMVANIKLKEIPGESYTESHLVSMFLTNIEDSEYDTVKNYLQQSGTKTLDECVNALRKEEHKKKVEFAKGKVLKHALRRMSGSYQVKNQPPMHVRRIGYNEPQSKCYFTNHNGFITVSSDEWHTLSIKVQDFIREYNGYV